jgi:hypothetical protein
MDHWEKIWFVKDPTVISDTMITKNYRAFSGPDKKAVGSQKKKRKEKKRKEKRKKKEKKSSRMRETAMSVCSIDSYCKTK